MNIKTIAKQWLVEHEHYEDEPMFQDDLESLVNLINSVLETDARGGYIGEEPEYDPKFGDDKLCLCGHPYYRHFDTYDHMAPIGCKYCHKWYDNTYGDNNCAGFKLAKEHEEECLCEFCIGS